MKFRVLAFTLILIGSADASAACVVVLRHDGVQLRYTAEIAETPAARSRGLMYRKQLLPRHGMWFDFGRDVAVMMWMKNTLIALDMLFVDRHGELISIEHGVPLSEERISAPKPVRYVFEINAGAADAMNIRRGDRLLLGRGC